MSTICSCAAHPCQHGEQAALAAVEAASSADLPAARTPFGAVQVDAAHCSGCGLCARFCPTGALQFTQADGRFALAFQPAACIACNICVVACPEDAASLGDTVALAALMADAVMPLVQGELAPRCHVCRQGSGPVTALRDEAGPMADLLARTPQQSRSTDH